MRGGGTLRLFPLHRGGIGAAVTGGVRFEGDARLHHGDAVFAEGLAAVRAHVRPGEARPLQVGDYFIEDSFDLAEHARVQLGARHQPDADHAVSGQFELLFVLFEIFFQI